MAGVVRRPELERNGPQRSMLNTMMMSVYFIRGVAVLKAAKNSRLRTLNDDDLILVLKDYQTFARELSVWIEVRCAPV